ncbi:MAG: YkgJ family cysteine cluster protein [Candidatus Edwardsbacteria bacterium]
MSFLLKIKQFIPSDFCLSCDGCCRFLQKETVWTPLRVKLLPYQDYYICQHLDVTHNLCLIYPQRPFDCQLYPFVLAKNDEDVYLALDENCRFLNKKKGEEFNKYVDYLISLFTGEEMKKMVKDNLQLIVSYPNVTLLKRIESLDA